VDLGSRETVAGRRVRVRAVTDEGTRELERLAAGGEPEAIQAWLRSLLREALEPEGFDAPHTVIAVDPYTGRLLDARLKWALDGDHFLLRCETAEEACAMASRLSRVLPWVEFWIAGSSEGYRATNLGPRGEFGHDLPPAPSSWARFKAWLVRSWR